MWKIAASKDLVFLGSRLGIWRGFHTGLVSSNWMLSNDIVRNALTSKFNPNIKNPGSQNRGPPKKMTKNRAVNKNKLQNKRNPTISWNSGSDRDKEVANSVLSQIFRMNKAGAIKVVNPETSKLEETNIRSFAKDINLEENGLIIVNFEEVDELTKIPLVKLVDRKTAMKRYSDERAKRKEQEMINLGLLKKKFIRSGEGEKAEDNVKQIRISWQIKNDDLNRQKSHEITNQLKKGYKVHLYIDDKSNINSKNWAAEFGSSSRKARSKELTSKEMTQRNYILEQLLQMVGDYAVQPVIEGTVETKLLMKLTPRSITTDANDKQSLKEQRRRERQEKLQLRIERKKQRSVEKDV